jgi:Zn-dependent protease
VLFTEPNRTPYDLCFNLFGIPVRVHPFFWLAALILGAGSDPDPVELLIWVGVFFASILIHEMGHAFLARAHGWQPWITLYGFGGLASYRPTYRSHAAQLMISFAGPGAGFLFAGLICGAVVAAGHQVVWSWPHTLLPVQFEGFDNPKLNLLIAQLLYVNIFWGLANLLPIWPLDGGRISGELFTMANPRDGLKLSLVLSIFVAVGAAVLVYTRLHDQFLALFCAYLAYNSYAALQSYTGGGYGGGYGGYR